MLETGRSVMVTKDEIKAAREASGRTQREFETINLHGVRNGL